MDAESACDALFPEAMWVPYTGPGVSLCLFVKRQFEEYVAQHGHEPSVVIMQNHGLVVAADTAEEIDALHEQVFATLKDAYRNAGLDTRSLIFETERADSPLQVEPVSPDEQGLAVRPAKGAVRDHIDGNWNCFQQIASGRNHIDACLIFVSGLIRRRRIVQSCRRVDPTSPIDSNAVGASIPAPIQ